jgi:muramidase (phage lysozyme)
MDNINKAGKDGEGTRVLMKPEVVRSQLRDVKSIIVEASKNPDATMLKNITKGVFGPSETSFISQRFAKDSQMEVFATLASPDVTKAMARLKDSDPASWNMYSKWVTDNFNSQFRRAATDLKEKAQGFNGVVNLSWNAETSRFEAAPAPGINPDAPVLRQAGKNNPLAMADELNNAINILKPVIEANGDKVNDRLVDVLRSMNLDPASVSDKAFLKVKGDQTDPDKHPYIFNDLSRQGQKDEHRSDEGLITFSGKVTDPDDVQSGILRTIRKAEAGGGTDSYGRVFGTRNAYPLTKMSVDEVMRLQGQMRGAGSPSTAVGAYQFLGKTLARLKTEMGLTGEEKFDQPLQDKMAVALMKGRGYDDWQGGKITRKQFVDRLAMEWAGLPNTSGKSHYHGDGLNRATIRLRELLNVLPQSEKGTAED